MPPPTAPRSDPLKIIFLDIPAGITEEGVLKLETSYQEFLGLLCKLSGGVADKIPNLPQARALGQGLTLNDGPWWYRLVKKIVAENENEPGRVGKGQWNLLDNPYAYDHLIGQMCLGVDTGGGWIEVQHDLQKKRDESQALRARTAPPELPVEGRRIASQNDPIPHDYRAHDDTFSNATNGGNAVDTFNPRGGQDADASLLAINEYHVTTDGNIQNTRAPSSYVPPVIVSNSPVRYPAMHQRNASMMSTSSAEKFPDLPMSEASPLRSLGTIQDYASGVEDFQPGLVSGYPPQYQPFPQYLGVHFNNVQPIFPPGPPPDFKQGNGAKSNNRGNRGRGQSRGRGRGRLPSFTPRPPPFPAQIGTPPHDAYDQYKQAFPDDFKSPESEVDTGYDLDDKTVEANTVAHGNQGFKKPRGNANVRPRGNQGGTRYQHQRNVRMSRGYHTSPSRNQAVPHLQSTMPPREVGMQHGYNQAPNLAQFNRLGPADMDYNFQATPSSGYGQSFHSQNPGWSYDPLVPYGGPRVRPYGSPSDGVTMLTYINHSYGAAAAQPGFPGFDHNLSQVNTDIMTESEIYALNEAYSHSPPRSNPANFAGLLPVPPQVTSVSPFPPSNAFTTDYALRDQVVQPESGFLTAVTGPQSFIDPSNRFMYFNTEQQLPSQFYQNPLQHSWEPLPPLSMPPPTQRLNRPSEQTVLPTWKPRSSDPKIGSGTSSQAQASMSRSSAHPNAVVPTYHAHPPRPSSRDFNPLFTSPNANRALPLFRPPTNAQSPPKGNFSPPKPRTQRNQYARKVFAHMPSGSVDMSIAAFAGGPMTIKPRKDSSAAAVKFGFAERDHPNDHNSYIEPEDDDDDNLSSLSSNLSEPSPAGSGAAMGFQPTNEEYSARMQKREENRRKEVEEVVEMRKNVAERKQVQRADREARAARRASRKSGEDVVEVGDDEVQVQSEEDGGKGDGEKRM